MTECFYNVVKQLAFSWTPAVPTLASYVRIYTQHLPLRRDSRLVDYAQVTGTIALNFFLLGILIWESFCQSSCGIAHNCSTVLVSEGENRDVL